MKKYHISAINDPVLAARLISIGIYPGKTMLIVRKALFGGAYYIEIDGSHFAIREYEMNQITKEEISTGYNE